MQKKREIVVCEKCKGIGTVWVMTDPHKGDGEYEDCKHCAGAGRVWRETTVTEWRLGYERETD